MLNEETYKNSTSCFFFISEQKLTMRMCGKKSATMDCFSFPFSLLYLRIILEVPENYSIFNITMVSKEEACNLIDHAH